MAKQINFDDSFYGDSARERANGRAFEIATRDTMDFIHTPPLPRRHRVKVICLECSTPFSTSNAIPECPGCGGGDIELR